MPNLKSDKSQPTKDLKIRPWHALNMYGNVQWHNACGELMSLLKSEPAIDEEGKTLNFKPIPDRRAVFENRVIRYIQYVKMFQKLEECMHLLIHPQKRMLLRKCIEGVATRICELKHEMIATDLCLYSYFDDILFDLGLTPDDITVRVPNFMYVDRSNILRMREHLLMMMIERMKLLKEPTPEDSEAYPVTRLGDKRKVSNEEDDRKSQKSQRSQNSQIIETEELPYSTQKPGRPEPICVPYEANMESYTPQMFIVRLTEKVQLFNDKDLTQKIVLLQAWWRGYLCRRKLFVLREKEDIDLGMDMAKYQKGMDPRQLEDYEKKQKMFEERDEELEISRAIEHERFMAAHGHNMAWELKYNITQWLLELRDMQGTFPTYPEEEEGGCEKLFAMKTVEEVEEEIREREEAEQNKQQPKPKEAEKPKKAEAELVGWVPAPTVALPKIIDSLMEYNSYWHFKDEMDNVEQKFDRQLMLEEVRNEAGKQIRLQVDELMRYELDKLRCGIEMIEMPGETKKVKPEEKEKINRDPLAAKSVEELYGELVLSGIVQPVTKVQLDGFLGEYNFLDEAQANCIPTASDIRTLITHFILLPLSSNFLHSNLPLVNRMLLAGPSGVGKTMLVHAICRETGANLMNLSPKVLAGKYLGPQGQEYLMNVLLKVGKSMEPTVFLVEDCEIMYPMPGQAVQIGDDRPQRWSSVFYRMMDKMKKGDRMFLFGTTNNPFSSNNQPMFDLYRNIVYIPLPEYGSRVALWKEFLARMPICNCLPYTLNSSVLAQCSEGFSGRQIELAVNNVLTPKRLNQFRPVTNTEMIHMLILDHLGPLDEDVQWAWAEWYARIPLMRKREQRLLEEEEALEGQATTGTPRK